MNVLTRTLTGRSGYGLTMAVQFEAPQPQLFALSLTRGLGHIPELEMVARIELVRTSRAAEIAAD